MKLCSIDDCNREALARSWCQRHYNRWHRGRPIEGRTRLDPNEIRQYGEIAEVDVYNTRGEVVHTFLIDAEDQSRVSQYKWGYLVKTDRSNWGPYIVRHGKGGGIKTIYLARYLMNPIPNGRKWVVDHIDGNTLNNRKSNLRVVKQQINIENTKVPQGVVLSKERGWVARISRGFETEDQAWEQRRVWEKERI